MNALSAVVLLALATAASADGGLHGHGGGYHGGHDHHKGSSGSFSTAPGKDIVHTVPLTVPSPYAVHVPVHVPVVKKYPVEHHVTIIKKIKVPITTVKKVPVEVIKKVPVKVPVHVHDHHSGGYGHH